MEEAEKQAVVDSYQNLGLVQVSGYLNVRGDAGLRRKDHRKAGAEQCMRDSGNRRRLGSHFFWRY